MTRARRSKPNANKKAGRYDRQDIYYQKAKDAGYQARSIYKLEEIDQVCKILNPSDLVLDLGAAPGSWGQYVDQKLGPKGAYVGIDLLQFKAALACKNKILRGDLYDIEGSEFLEHFSELKGKPVEGIQLVLSDMAPNTTGIRSVDQDRSMGLCELALHWASELLAPGGNFCVKIFEGGGIQRYVAECRKLFKVVKIKRPKGVRPGSMETYIIGMGRK